MKGSNSIKVVLPAILNSSKAIQKKYSQPIYGSLIPSKNFGKDNAKALLLYCELDTMSMVFIWEYFDEMTKKY